MMLARKCALQATKGVCRTHRYLHGGNSQPQTSFFRRRPVIASLATVGGVLATSATIHYSHPLLFPGIARYLRAVVTCGIISMDYKYHLWKHAGDKEAMAKLHSRAAHRILDLCLINTGGYIKIGQYLASLNHMLPTEYTTTLAVLQDKAPWVPYDDVEQIIAEELGKPVSELFSEFSHTPIAAGSIAQVHKAIVKATNQEVAVKVQYPRVRNYFDIDMNTSEFLLWALKHTFKGWDFEWANEYLRTSLRRELDFETEAQNGERAAANFANRSDVYIPKVVKNISTARVLTTEFIHGIKITDLEQLRVNRLSQRDVTRIMLEAFSDQIYLHGFIHCDPHPGNILVRKLPNGKPQVVILDHGLYEELPNDVRVHYCKLWRALVLRDNESLALHSAALGVKEYKMLAVMLLMRSYEGANVGLSSKMSTEEIEAILATLHTQMEKYIEIMKQMPREVLLVMRNNNLIRSINQELGTPVNRFEIMARSAVRGIHRNQNIAKQSISGRLLRWRDSFLFSLQLKWFTFTYLLQEWWVALQLILGLVTPAQLIDSTAKEMWSAA